MRLIVTHEASMIADLTCERETLPVGSAADCKVQLADPRIAPQHALIFPEGERAWAFAPAAPDALVFINGARVTEKVTLKTGDEIRICDHVIRVFPEQEPAAAAPAARPTSVARLTQFVQAQLPPGSLTKRTDEPLGLQGGHLARMADVVVRLSQADSVPAVMESALRTLVETFGAHKVWIGVRRVNYGPMEWVEGRTMTGQATELPEIGELLKPRVLDRGQFVLVPRVSADELISVLAAPLAGTEALLGMVYLDSGETGRRFDARDLDLLMVIAGLIAAQVDAILRQVARNRAATIAGEVSVAHAIQARITPRKLPQWEELQFGTFREPGSERTGNIFDVVRLGNNTACFMVAHTGASGPMPSMLMAQSQAAFRLAAMHMDPPHVFLKSLNWLLYDGLQDRPLSCFVGWIDPASGLLRYALAGQMGAYIIGQRGDERSLLPAEPQPPLSLTKNHEYPLLEEQLSSGETLALFTPGVTTATNRAGETFGEERFVDILCDGFGQLASTMLKEMLHDLRMFTEGGSQPDDITVVLAHRV
jgi:sigma-B regulation protein RsbU (phosphoserine phosphatase)